MSCGGFGLEFSLCLKFLEEVVEGGELFFPELAEGFDPVGDLAQWGQGGLCISLAALLADGDEAAFRQQFYMLGDGGAAAVEVFGDGVEVHGLSGYEAEDVSAGGVGDGLEYVSACLHGLDV